MKSFIAANWKMNKTIAETQEFLRDFIPAVKDVIDLDIVIAPPFTSLAAAGEALKGTNVQLAAQDMFWEEKGAYTGEVSPAMLLDAGCRHVIIGHSERRQYFHEDDAVVNNKIKAAKKAGLGVIFCCGESLQEREANMTFDVIGRGIENGLDSVDAENLVVAYEPIWAIGTGRTASPEQAQEVHAFIRGRLRTLYGSMAEGIRILYGGSVTPENVELLMACEDVNGGLVGGASLKPDSFAKLVCYKKEK
ncbi:MAG: triose-phosphate isomerase [Nitrospirota bacterium]|nr:triose-phosphate isomerase [Nitrospirota bacterium]